MAETAINDPCIKTNSKGVALEDIINILEKAYSG